MKLRFARTVLWVLALCLLANAKRKLDWDAHDHFVVEHDPIGPASLEEVTRALGVELVEQVGELENHWLVRTRKYLGKRDEMHPVTSTFNSLRLRAIEGFQPRTASESDDKSPHRIINSIRMLKQQELRQRIKRTLSDVPPKTSSIVPQTRSQPTSKLRRRQQGLDEGPIKKFAKRFNIIDAIFPSQWQYVNDQFPQHTMNVTGLWEMGITGKGVISAMVDDGLDYESEDLADNFVSDFLSTCRNRQVYLGLK